MDPQSVLALTATAGPPVINDICSTLRIRNDSIETKILNCNRHNIDVSATLFDNDHERYLKVK